MLGLMRSSARTFGSAMLVLPIVALLGAGGAAASPAAFHSRDSKSGISGRVVIGPTCPVQRAGQTCVCPYQAMIAIRRPRTSRLVTRVRSSASGHFRVALAPGRYRLVPQGGPGRARSSPRTITVRSDRYTQVVISFDSGIR